VKISGPAVSSRAAAAGGPGCPAEDPASDRDLPARLALSGDDSFACGLDRFLDVVAALAARRASVGQ
jgi:hypothetical protein